MARVDVSHYLPLTPAMFQLLVALADGEKHGYASIKRAPNTFLGARRRTSVSIRA